MGYPGKKTALYYNHSLTHNMLTQNKCLSVFSLKPLFLFPLPFSPLSSRSTSPLILSACAVLPFQLSACLNHAHFIIFVNKMIQILITSLNLAFRYMTIFVSPAQSPFFSALMTSLSLIFYLCMISVSDQYTFCLSVV